MAPVHARYGVDEPWPGPTAALPRAPGWYDGYMFSQALTIGGGTGQVQRNIVAERVLGLPHDVDVQQGLAGPTHRRAGG